MSRILIQLSAAVPHTNPPGQSRCRYSTPKKNQARDPGNRNFYDADEMTDCEGCDELFSREHLVTVGVGEQAFLYCENCVRDESEIAGEMEQACEDGKAFDFCMNGCDDKKKKIIYELKEPGGSDIWWYCEDCADAKEIESGYLNHFAARFDKEESSPEPSQETTESSLEIAEPSQESGASELKSYFLKYTNG